MRTIFLPGGFELINDLIRSRKKTQSISKIVKTTNKTIISIFSYIRLFSFNAAHSNGDPHSCEHILIVVVVKLTELVLVVKVVIGGP